MLLPSGRSNNETRPLQKSDNSVVFETTSSSLALNLSNKQENSFSLETTINTDIAQNKTFNEKEFSKNVLLYQSNHIEADANINNYSPSIKIPLLESIPTAKNIPETISYQTSNWDEIDQNLKAIQLYLKEGWTVHLGNNGRLYYCNHLLQTSGWLPSLEDWIKHEDVPYGWERAIDSKGRYYYINHLNKTSTYEAPEKVKWDENPPEPRLVVLERNPSLGFGFVAGSEKPVIVRFVTDGGPSIKKLQPGDQILAVNGEDVKDAPRDHVIQLVRACENEVSLLVCQPAHTYAPGRKSTLLSAGKRAKLRSRPNRVRFAESVCVNGAPLFPASAFSLSDICVPPMANVLKVFLENGQTKSFKYDASTTVQDVVSSLLDKLCLKCGEIFSLVLEHVKSLKRNKFTLLDPEETLARIAARPGSHKLRCLFRVVFVPNFATELAQRDLNALDYLYTQCCNDVVQERFAPELQPEVALRLASLHIHQHALDNNISPNKLNVKVIEREFGLERFVPTSLYEGMKRKELRRLLTHFLKLHNEMTGSTAKILTQLQAKLHYLDTIASLPSYGAKCFSTNQKIGVERVLLIGPRFGLSQISNARNSVPQAISPIEGITHIIVNREDDISCSVGVFMQDDRAIRFSMEDRDASEFSLVLAGYHKVLTGKVLTVIREQEPFEEDNAPSYLTQHTVLPSSWSYLELYHDCIHSINFLTPPPYHNLQENYVIKCDNNMNSSNVADSNQSSPKIISNNVSSMDLDMHSVVATELLEEAKDSGISDSSGTGSYYFEQPQICENSNFVETKNQAVLRRVQEMQIMVKNSEQYLNEQGDSIKDIHEQRTANEKFSLNGNFWLNDERTKIVNKSFGGTLDFDSDCDSLNSSKISSTEEHTEQSSLKHSDSLTLLAESINQDLSGISQELTSINDGGQITTPFSLISCSRPELRMQGFTEILSNLQTLGTDYYQSESDAESVISPTNSPSSRRPSILNTNGDICQKNYNKTYRGSFGLHSPDDNNFMTNNVNLSLKEYIKEFCKISNENNKPRSNENVMKLSTLYSKNLVENDTDLIDLRAIPPPQTPDDLDSFLVLNAPPKEFDDAPNKVMPIPGEDGELEQFLKNVVVAPPTQKTTPAKELTPEEIMSYIIPPPPDSDTIEATKYSSPEYDSYSHKEHVECLYSNSNSLKKSLENTIHCEMDGPHGSSTRIIEYASIERKSNFSCCPKIKREEIVVHENISHDEVDLKLPPRLQVIEKFPPARPPKSKELIQRFSPKKQLPQGGYISSTPHSRRFQSVNENPPLLPPRPNQTHINCGVRPTDLSTVSMLPKMASIAPIIGRPMYLRSNPKELCLLTENESKICSPTLLLEPKARLPLRPSNLKTLKIQNQILNSPNFEVQYPEPSTSKTYNEKCIERNGHVIDGEALLAKTDVAMAGLLVKLDQVAAQCTTAQAAGGGASIDEEKFQRARNELTEQTLVLVTASKFLVVAMSDVTPFTLPEHLTSCLTALRSITELTKDMIRHTSSPLQTRNIVLKVHDVASHFRELVQVQIGPLGAGKLALQAECLANVLATLLRSLRVFSP